MAVTLAGLPVIAASITMPLLGAWHADAHLDASTAPTGRVTLDVDGVQFVGSVFRSGVQAGRVHVRMVGGGGGLQRTLPGRFYVGLTARQPLLDALSEAGETLAATAEAAPLAFALGRWERQEGPAAHALTALARVVGATWRMLRDGTVWLGTDTWPTATVEHVLLDEDWTNGVITVAPTTVALLPGVTFRDRRIAEVVHSVSAAGVRTEARLASAGALLQSILERAPISGPQRYLGVYGCRVLAQSGDRCDVIPDDARLRGVGGLSSVPIRHGLPGVTINVPDGTRALLEFESGDPSRPIVRGFDDAADFTLVSIGGADFVALAGLVLSQLQAIKTHLDAHTHGTGVGPTTPPTVPMPAPQSVAAAKVKAT